MIQNEERSISILKERLGQLVDEFHEKLINGTNDPDTFLTISEIERLSGELKGNTGVLYSHLLEETLKQVNERDLISKKKQSI